MIEHELTILILITYFRFLIAYNENQVMNKKNAGIIPILKDKKFVKKSKKRRD